MNDLAQLISNLNDDDFLQYARWFVRGELTLSDYVQLRDMIKNRCHKLGYAFTNGCCGQNNIIKISHAK